MTFTGIVLVAISCFTHSGWNLLAKRQAGQNDFFWWVLLAITGGLAVPCVAGLGILAPPLRFWLLALGSGACLSVYFASLAMSYRRGDLSIIYPVARSAPVFILAWTEIFLGVRHNAPGYAGLGLIVLGAVMLPLWTGTGWNRWLNPGNFWALVTALATSGYSICDHAAMGIVRAASVSTPVLVGGAICYLWLQFSIGLVLLTALLWPTVCRPRAASLRTCGRDAVLVAALNALTYTLVLLAMMTSKVTYVVAFRQFSIVLGVLMGITILGERKGALSRLVGATIITSGLIMIALAR